MKTFIMVGAMVLVPFSFINAATDYYLKLGGVEGETTTRATSSPTTSATVQTTSTQSNPEGTSKGKVETGLKVEEGTDEERLRGLERAEQVILENAKASDQSIESISLNFQKITTRVRHEVKVFGFIPVTTTAEVDIDAQEIVKVKFPWWTFLASDKDKDEIGKRVLENLSEVLKNTPKKEGAKGNVEFEWKVEEGES